MTQLYYHISPPKSRSGEGSISAKNTVNGINCQSCGTWTGLRRVPTACPPALSLLLNSLGPKPVSPESFSQIQNCWGKSKMACVFPDMLLPGDMFMPLLWEQGPTIKSIGHWPFMGKLVTSKSLAQKVLGFPCSEVRLIDVGVGSRCDHVEWNPVASTKEASIQTQGNWNIRICRICGKEELLPTESHKSVILECQEDHKLPVAFVPKANIFTSHIFSPGFVVAEPIAQRMQDAGFNLGSPISLA